MRCNRVIAAVAGLAFVIGCGSDEDKYPLVKVNGTVTRNGKPMAKAKISFVPDSGNKYSTPATDETGSEGNYMLLYKGRNGVAPGKYKVLISPAIELPSAKIPEEFKNDPLMGQMALGVGPGLEKKGAAGKKDAANQEFEREAEVEDTSSSQEINFDVKD